MEKDAVSGLPNSFTEPAIKQGYLIKFYRGPIKVPKMQYFVLMPASLTWFSYMPDHETSPIGTLPLRHLTSIKIYEVELNSCLLSCMAVTCNASNFVLAFSRKEERDAWMTAIMKAFAENFVSTLPPRSQLVKSRTAKIPVGESSVIAAAVTQFHGMVSQLSNAQAEKKRRKRNREQTVRKSKSIDNLNQIELDKFSDIPRLEPEDVTVFYEPQRKRKSEPDIHNVITDFALKWATESRKATQDTDMKVFRCRCFDHRDSFDLTISKRCNMKCAGDEGKSNIITRIISKFENSTKLVNFKS